MKQLDFLHVDINTNSHYLKIGNFWVGMFKNGCGHWENGPKMFFFFLIRI